MWCEIPGVDLTANQVEMCKPATGGQLSITSLQPQHGPLFLCSGLLIFSLFKWIFLINAFALSKGHPLGFVLSTDKFYSAHGQL